MAVGVPLCVGAGVGVVDAAALGLSRLEPNRLPKNAPMLLELGAAEATCTGTGFASADVIAKTLAMLPCGNESAGGWTCAGMVPAAVRMGEAGPPWDFRSGTKE